MNIIPIQAPIKVSDWQGLHVRNYREIRNHYFVFPAGTVFEVTSASGRKSLKSLPCKCCGMSGLILMGGTKREFLMDFEFVELENETK